MLKKTIFEKIFNYIKLFSLFSLFTGILFQYISIKRNMSFFSYSEVINDSIFIVPLIIIFLLSMYLFYKYILYFRNNNVLKINDTLWAIF
jgi:hypothetical protein